MNKVSRKNGDHRMEKQMTDKQKMDKILNNLQSDRRVQQMKNYIQHGRVSTFDHCDSVARLSCKLNRKFNLHANVPTLVKGAMLHDFYLYDWHHKDNGEHTLHGYSHAEKARENAEKYFDVDEDVQHIIYSHMWPLNLTHVPRSREAWIVCLADKYVSLKETILER